MAYPGIDAQHLVQGARAVAEQPSFEGSGAGGLAALQNLLAVTSRASAFNNYQHLHAGLPNFFGVEGVGPQNQVPMLLHLLSGGRDAASPLALLSAVTQHQESMHQQTDSRQQATSRGRPARSSDTRTSNGATTSYASRHQQVR